MRLPNAENATIEIEKLRDYCLDPEHPRGKHKARVFLSALALTKSDSDELREIIACGILESDCEPGDSDEFGERFVLDFTVERAGKSAQIRTSWIILTDEKFPRLTSCYVKR